MVLATPDMVVMVLATTARGPLRPSLRLMPSSDTELTPTPLPTATLPLPLPLLPSLPLSLPPPSLPTLLPPLPLATLVLDTPVLATLVLVLEPTELTELTTVNFAQQQKLNTVSTVSSPVMGVGHLVLSGERESCLV